MANEELVKLIQNSENVSENMEQLYMKNKGFIYKIVHNRTDNINELDDLMQQAYFGLYNAALTYNQGEMQCSFISILKFYILNSIPDESIEDFDDIIEREDLKRIVNSALSKLSTREEHILRELYYKNRTLESVGNDTGIGRERVRQLKERGLRNLRKDTQFVKATEDYRSYTPTRHVGLNEFKRTGISSVEWSVMQMERQSIDDTIAEIRAQFGL